RAIGMVIKVYRRCKVGGGVLKLCRLCPEVAELFTTMGLNRLFEIHPDEASALKSDWPQPTPAPTAAVPQGREGPAPPPTSAATPSAPSATLSPSPKSPPRPAARAVGDPLGDLRHLSWRAI